MNLLQKIEILTGQASIHPSRCDVSRCPAGHGAPDGVKRIGGAGQLQPQHVDPQKKFIAVDGGLPGRISGREMPVGYAGAA
jgi:hypothetical protein